jgi:hypothetical protein
LWEAFLLQMNDFDRFLEIELRHMLGPVTATPAPPLKARRKASGRPPVVVLAPIELTVEAVAVVEPVAVPVPVAPPA